MVKSGKEQTNQSITSNQLSKVLFDDKAPNLASYEQVIIDDILKDYKVDNTSKKPHILIIDEINRGNISRIFGELITLIEPSKRAGKDEEISVQLPYSKKPFSVPNNLHIIGTMNTADRSLALMDTALRRRFDFTEIMPDADLVKGNFDGIEVEKILERINQRIEILYDREHTIGHSFLMNVKGLKELQNAFKNRILPLLEEYFYDDWYKIKAVLSDKGDKFYQEIKQDKDLFAGMQVDYNQEQKNYHRQNCDGLTAQAFIGIYQSNNNE
ncbi:conserved domain protein [hydrothermal vent metagenome]|uniref:Conserved domain protein n=1 Tax=hydrothermal vent metagenome TaxID=652676 RepID=A0A1W1E345_9ZZZZ